MTQIVSADTEIRSLLDRQLKLKSDMEQYQGKIEAAPSVEKEYNELTMDYANAKKKYDDMLNKSMEARVAMQLQESQYGERFLIAEPAFLPQKPSKPNRLAIILLGFVLAFGAGASIAAILEGLDHSVKTDNELGRIMGVPVLSTISLVETDDEKQTKRLKRLLWFAGTAGAIAVTLIIINSLIVPLDQLWESLRIRMKI
jgi:capsular polysaccharide biosynthesis protein